MQAAVGHINPSPPTSAAAGTVEVYAFASLILLRLSFLLFLAWAYLPDRIIESIGITYYPTKEWATILPAWVIMSLLMAAWAYQRLNSGDVVAFSSQLVRVSDPLQHKTSKSGGC